MRWVTLFYPAAIIAFSIRSSPAAPPTAEQIARRVQDRDTGRDSRAEMRMTLFDRHGRVRERALTIVTLRGRGNPGAAKTAPDGDRLLIRFTYPADIRGTSFLVWEHPKTDDERFLFLPSLGRVRRIAGTEAQESFVGSDFTYEDIGGREFDDYSYALESRRKDSGAAFPRVVSLILKDTYIVVQADIYNRRNEAQKVYSVRRIQQVQGIWTVFDSSMANILDKTQTHLVVEKVGYNIGLREDAFSRRELESGK